ncbi:hypothetical protein BG004_000523 [Podila humilis]|nr:hypothetical protein BG004_000523 [Podila humilis]
MSSGAHEPVQQWNQFDPASTSQEPPAYTLARPSRYTAYNDDDDRDRDASSSDGYLSSSSSSSGGSLASSLSQSNSDEDEDEDEDEDMESDESCESDSSGDDESDNQDQQDNEAPTGRDGHRIRNSRHHLHHHHHDYYGGGRGVGDHGGLLPIASAPAIPPSSDRDALEQEARQRRLEKDSAKRRQSLTNQATPINDDDNDNDDDDDSDDTDDWDDVEDDEEVDDGDDEKDSDRSDFMDSEDSERNGDDGSDTESESDSDSDSSSDEESYEEANETDELDAMSCGSMSEIRMDGQNDHQNLRYPPQGHVFGGDDLLPVGQSMSEAGTDFSCRTGTFDLGHGPSFYDVPQLTHPTLLRMSMDLDPTLGHGSHDSIKLKDNNNSNNNQLRSQNTHHDTIVVNPAPWDTTQSNFGQETQLTFTQLRHIYQPGNHQPLSNRNELEETTAALANTYVSNRAFFSPTRALSRCWKRSKRS